MSASSSIDSSAAKMTVLVRRWPYSDDRRKCWRSAPRLHPPGRRWLSRKPADQIHSWQTPANLLLWSAISTRGDDGVTRRPAEKVTDLAIRKDAAQQGLSGACTGPGSTCRRGDAVIHGTKLPRPSRSEHRAPRPWRGRGYAPYSPDRRSTCLADTGRGKSGSMSCGASAITVMPVPGPSEPTPKGGASSDQFAPLMPAASTLDHQRDIGAAIAAEGKQRALHGLVRIGGRLAICVERPAFGNPAGPHWRRADVDEGGGARRLVDDDQGAARDKGIAKAMGLVQAGLLAPEPATIGGPLVAAIAARPVSASLPTK